MSLVSMFKGKGPSGFGYGSTAEDVTEGLDLTGQTILLTRCNSGIGKETLRVLAKRGAHVVAAARTRDKAAAACAELGGATTPVACELSDPASVQACAAEVKALGRPLNAIVCNAGIMALPKLHLQHGYELVWGVPSGGVRALWRPLAWLAGFLAIAAAAALVDPVLDGVAWLVAILVIGLPVTVAWAWWTQYLLLAGRVRWSRLLPGAVLIGLGLVGLRLAATVVLSPGITSQYRQYGPLGIVFVMLSWFVGMTDWPQNNWWGANSNDPPGPFLYFGWDAEWSWLTTRGHNNGWVHPDFRSGNSGGATIAALSTGYPYAPVLMLGKEIERIS